MPQNSSSASYHRIARLISTFAVCLTFHSPPTAADDLPVKPEELRDRCAKGIDRIEAAYGQMQGKGTLRSRNVYRNPVGAEHLDAINFACDGKDRLLVEYKAICTFRGGDRLVGRTSVNVATPKQCFQLHKNREDGSYTTDYMCDENIKAYEEIRSTIDARSQMLTAPYRIANWLSPAQLVKHPSCVAKSISAVARGNLAGIRVEFEATGSSEKSDFLRTWRDSGKLSGWYVACPEQSWAIHQYEFRHYDKSSNGQLTHTGKAQYGSVVDGIPILKSAEHTMALGAEVVSIHEINLTEIKLGPPPPNVFSEAIRIVGFRIGYGW